MGFAKSMRIYDINSLFIRNRYKHLACSIKIKQVNSQSYTKPCSTWAADSEFCLTRKPTERAGYLEKLV